MPGKAANLALITAAQVLALSLFSGTAAGPGMKRDAAAVGAGFRALLTGAVQAGFVAGTLASALLALPDRFDPRRVFAAAALLGAAANAAILALPAGADTAIAARFATGAALAGVYPVGMKLAAGWADRGDTGLVVAGPDGAPRSGLAPVPPSRTKAGPRLGRWACGSVPAMR